MKALHEAKEMDRLGEVIDIVLLEAKNKSIKKAEKEKEKL